MTDPVELEAPLEGGAGLAGALSLHAETAVRAAGVQPYVIDPSRRPMLVLVPHGHDLETVVTEQYETRPFRRRGTTTIHDPASFGAWVQDQATDESAVYVDLDHAPQAVAVFDDHHPAGPDASAVSVPAGWGENRAELHLRAHPDWEDWRRHEGKGLSQGEFATLLDRLSHTIPPTVGDIRQMSGSELAGLIDDLSVSATTEVKEAKVLDNTRIQVMFAESVNIKTGTGGGLIVPSKWEIALQPFYGLGDRAFSTTVRLRVVPQPNKSVAFRYMIPRADDVQRRAVDWAVNGIALADHEHRRVFHGRPATDR